MLELIDRQICFRLPDAGPPASPSGPFRLADTPAEALSELLQVFACGEESAALAFAHFGLSPIEDAARRGLARVAKEELVHERLLRGLRNVLPAPTRDRELRCALLRFYYGMAQADIGLHLASIAAVDFAVCVILAALLEPDRTLAREPAVAAILRRIHRDEAGHVRLSHRLAAAFAHRDAMGVVAGMPWAWSPKCPIRASLALSRGVGCIRKLGCECREAVRAHRPRAGLAFPMTGASPPVIWHDRTPLRVLGTGAALPGQPISREELLTAMDRRFGLSLRRQGMTIANKLGIRTRHLCRDMMIRLETHWFERIS